LLLAELLVLLVDPRGGLLDGGDGHEALRLRKLALVYEGSESICEGIGADDLALLEELTRDPA
jgi:hypothetical protein